MARVLIFTADIGAGHDLPAARLADALRRRNAEPTIVDSLAAVGGFVQWAIRDGIESVLHEHPERFDMQFRPLQRPVLREAASSLALKLGGGALLREIAEARADIVVSTYPGATELLGRLRQDGRLDIPVVSAITDLAALRYWSHPGVDLHLLIHPESIHEVRAIAGADTRIAVVRGLSDPVFESLPTMAEARTALGLDVDRQVVAVSGGGWGVGDIEGAAGVARATGASVVMLCGSNDSLRDRMETTFDGDDSVLVLGFTDRMPEVLSAADVLVHSTAGLTVLEAIVCGARPISFGWGVGHIRINNRAYEATGLADVAADTHALAAALDRALASPPVPDESYGRRPSAAGAVLALLESAPLDLATSASTAEDRASQPAPALQTASATRMPMPPPGVCVQDSPATTGASATGTAVWMTKIGTATRATAIRCIAPISSSRPTPATAAMKAAHAAATSHCLFDTSVARMFVAMPDTV